MPGKETAGSGKGSWDHARTDEAIQREINAGSTLVLPLATLIETGNHIAKASSARYKTALALAENLKKAAAALTPWAAFTQQTELWKPDALHALSEAWPNQAAAGLSLGDATIGSVADFYSRTGYEVYLLTADQGLQEHVSTATLREPRRRKLRRSEVDGKRKGKRS